MFNNCMRFTCCQDGSYGARHRASLLGNLMRRTLSFLPRWSFAAKRFNLGAYEAVTKLGILLGC